MLTDKVALVTGASRGIGRATALLLAERGANVVVNYAGNQVAAEEVVARIQELGSRGIAVRGDVANGEDAAAMVQAAIDAFGRLDILVNNAGITRDNLLIRMKDEEWDQVIATNLKGVYNCTKAAARIMMKQRFGRIINLTSVVALLGNPGQANYVAAKSGVIGLTKSNARELASRNITVNAVAPGYIQTDMTAALNEDVKESLQQQIPLGRLGEPEDIAKMIAFLASDDASYITGQVFSVDGGMAM
jgi:3-oxoacyl-[acyl-carrier protein] reductase